MILIKRDKQTKSKNRNILLKFKHFTKLNVSKTFSKTVKKVSFNIDKQTLYIKYYIFLNR